MKLTVRQLWIYAAIAMIAIILITIIAAPAKNQINSGSTYGRSPDGYGAWYAFMSERKTPIQRWQKPFEYLAKTNQKSPITLLRIYSNLDPVIGDAEDHWIKAGNTLIILGVRSSITEAPFTTFHKQQYGRIKIDTSRREKNVNQIILGDEFGAIVWQEIRGKGRLIYGVTPYLAANAYQDSQANYEFLAELINYSENNQVFVDEYIHGYTDKIITQESEKNLISYLGKTPLFIVLIQGFIIAIIAIWASNRRLGNPVIFTSPPANNSATYIEALATVLQKAESSELIVEVVGRAEQLKLQKALGLSGEQVNNQSLIEAWGQQTGRPITELEQLLEMRSQKRRLHDAELLTWLKKWQNLRS